MNKRVVSAALAVALSGCSSGGSSILPYMQNGAVFQELGASGAGKIKHVVYIVQENRSFDNLFQGYPHADTVSAAKIRRGTRSNCSRYRFRNSTK